ncbi:hypothetical protein BDR03DRAFT_862693, partial [Suillus americanus]
QYIHRYTGISERSMRCIQKTYRETGEVVRTPALCAGQPCILDSLDVNVYYYLFSVSLVCDFSIERQPDIFLAEMQDQLREICGVEASIATISRTIRSF